MNETSAAVENLAVIGGIVVFVAAAGFVWVVICIIDGWIRSPGVQRLWRRVLSRHASS